MMMRKVTMIDFPQMVSVSHRNAQMCRDVECIIKFFSKRFNYFVESKEHDNGLDVDVDVDADESAWPSFSSISKTAGFLDKELAASGFIRKEQDDIEKFIDAETEDTSSDVEVEEELNSKLSETNIKGMNSLDVRDEEGQASNSFDEKVEESQQISEEVRNIDHETDGALGNTEATSQSVQEEDDQTEDEDEDDPELIKRLNKEKRRAVAAARAGSRRLASRNSYKDKGGKSSSNSKIQKQLSNW